MVVKIEWKKLGFYEYYNSQYSIQPNGSNTINSIFIIIEEKKILDQTEIYTFNNDVLQSKKRPFPKEGIISLRCLGFDHFFPEITNRLQFIEKSLYIAEHSEKHEGTFNIEILEVGISTMLGSDINTNPIKSYKYVRIL